MLCISISDFKKEDIKRIVLAHSTYIVVKKIKESEVFDGVYNYFVKNELSYCHETGETTTKDGKVWTKHPSHLSEEDLRKECDLWWIVLFGRIVSNEIYKITK